MAISSDLERLLARWLPRQRWMPALGGRVGEEPDITPLSVARIADVADDAVGTVQCLLVVLTVRGPLRHTRLCVPLSVRTVEDYSLRSHLVGVVDDLLLGRSYVYDGAADPVFVLALADAVRDAGGATDPQVQTFLAGDELPAVGDEPARVGNAPSEVPAASPATESGEETGESLLERASVHRFRRTDGLGSESRIEIDGPTGTFALTILREIGAENPPAVRYPLALTAVESASVHPAVGWSQTRWFDDTELRTIAAPFALLSHALPASRRAWRAAVETVMRVDSGSVGSFNREASTLGTAVGRLHVGLGAEFGLVRSEGDPTRRLLRKWRERVDWALSRAPGALGSLERGLRENADSLDDIDGVGPLQRIHGELTLDHITVGTAEGPRVISFAVTPDEPRPVEIDLVAMLRSIDYAAGYAWLQRTGALGEGEPRIRALATQGLEDTELRDDYLAAPEHLWYRQTANSLLSGYSHAGRETKSVTDPVLHAALIDRLLVEVVSEMRSRPAWLIVPLAALAAALGDGSHAATRPSPGAEDAEGEHGEGASRDEASRDEAVRDVVAAVADADGSADATAEDEDVFVTAARATSGAASGRAGDAGEASDREDPDGGIAEGADILPDRSRIEDDRPGFPRRRAPDEAAPAPAASQPTSADEAAADEAAADAGEAPDTEAVPTDAASDPTDSATDEDEPTVPAKPDRPPPGAIVPPPAAEAETVTASGEEAGDDPEEHPEPGGAAALTREPEGDVDPELDEDGAGDEESGPVAPPRSARDSRGATD